MALESEFADGKKPGVPKPGTTEVHLHIHSKGKEPVLGPGVSKKTIRQIAEEYRESSDTPHFGWLDPDIPHLDSFEDLISKDFCKLSDIAPEAMNALRAFELELGREITYEELLSQSSFLKLFSPDLSRDKFHFFFNLALTIDGVVVVTVFLEAYKEELADRPQNYRNANQNLHNAFFNSEGIIRKSPFAFQRDKVSARETESTAYAKFYIQKWSGEDPGISILMHPMQRARLAYNPSNDPKYKNFRQDLRNFAKKILVLAGRLQHSDNLEYQEYSSTLKEVGRSLMKIFSKIFKTNNLDVLEEETKKILSLLLKLPKIPELEVKSRKKGVGKQSVHKEIRAYLRQAQQVVAMYKKMRRGETAAYEAADRHTGKNREFLFLGISDLLKKCFEQETGKPTHRFMLSSSQIDTLRLKNEGGSIRERIKAVPLVLEEHCPVITTSYPLLPVDSNGKVGKRTEKFPISTIAIDLSNEAE